MNRQQNSEGKVKFINDLDDYSLLLIFSKLSIIDKIHIQFVCQRWKAVAEKLLLSQMSLGTNMSCTNCPDKNHQVLSQDCFHKIFKSANDGVSHLYFVDPSTLRSILSKCQNLKTLILRHCIFRKEIVDVFSVHCPLKLEHFDLSYSSCVINDILKTVCEKQCKETLRHVTLTDNDISEKQLRLLLQNCLQLEILNLNQNEGITGESFNLISGKLRQLSIVDCKNITDAGILSLVSGHGRNLSHLCLGKTTTVKMLEIICGNMSSLRFLEFQGFETDTPNDYNYLKLLTSLEELTLELPRFIFDGPLIEVMTNCRFLKKVQILGAIISDFSMSQFSHHCPSIEEISITPANSYTNSTITNICLQTMSSLKHLRKLCLSSSNITDSIVHVICSCTKLAFLELDGCRNISNLTLEACVHLALSKPNERLILFARNTNICRPTVELPENLDLFCSWGRM